MRSDYRFWLEAQKYAANTVNAQIHRIGKIEECYGSLEELFERDQFRGLTQELGYSVDDQRRNRPNNTKLKIEGDFRKGLASYKAAVVRYGRFLSGKEGIDEQEDLQIASSTEIATSTFSREGGDQRLSLERDMQAALRRSIERLSSKLKIMDDGAERSVDTGLIDITCEDEADGSIVVVELKAGKCDSRAIAQILGYMGDVSIEESGRSVRGILVAHDFDKRTIAAARAVKALKLFRYAVDFHFSEVSLT
jgi:endonuclease